MKRKFIVEKDFMHKGFRCVVIFGDLGYRCGYVGVDKKHLLYGIEYDKDLPKKLITKWKKILQGPVGKRGMLDIFCVDVDKPSLGLFFDVHGGVIFSGTNKEKDYPVKADLWWFGFDCGHYGDAQDLEALGRYGIGDKGLIEVFKNLSSMSNGVIRTLAYVEKECKSLADQLDSITSKEGTKAVIRRKITFEEEEGQKS